MDRRNFFVTILASLTSTTSALAEEDVIQDAYRDAKRHLDHKIMARTLRKRDSRDGVFFHIRVDMHQAILFAVVPFEGNLETHTVQVSPTIKTLDEMKALLKKFHDNARS